MKETGLNFLRLGKNLSRLGKLTRSDLVITKSDLVYSSLLLSRLTAKKRKPARGSSEEF